MLRIVIIFLFITISAIFAAPISDDAQAKILKYENENDGLGNYHFSFETSNGLEREETGTLVNQGQPDEHIEVRGSYRYTDDQGVPHFVQYFADQNGYQVGKEAQLTPAKPPSVQKPMIVIALPPAVVATFLG